MYENRVRSMWFVTVVMGICLAMVMAPGFAQAQQVKPRAAKPVQAQPSQATEHIEIHKHPVHLILVKYEGRVIEEGGKPIQGVQVKLTGPGTYTATTDANGVFRFPGVKPGTYNISLADTNNVYIPKPNAVKLYNLFEMVKYPR